MLPSFAAHRIDWQPAVLAAVLAAALYAVTLGGTYVYDDVGVIREDPRISAPGKWVRFFTERYDFGAADPLWRPLTCVSFAAQWHLHGDRAWAFHLVNILLHAAVSALVAMLAGRMTGSRTVALVAGLLFAAHPVHVEAAANIVGRAELLCAIGVIGGLVLYWRSPLTPLRVAAIVACFVLASLSKEHGILLPPMLLAVYLVRRWIGQDRATASERQAQLWLLVFMCFGIATYIAYRESIMHIIWDRFHMRWSVNPIVRSRGADRLLVPISIVGRYAILLLWPAALSPDYGANVTDYRMHWNDAYWYVGAAAIVAWAIGLIFAIRRRSAPVAACLVCFAIGYALISNFVYVIGTVMGERLIYIVSAFFVILLAIALARLPRRALTVVLAIILPLAALRTVTYAWQWNEPLRLYSHARQAQPRSVYLHVLEAVELMNAGDLEGAERLLARAREMGPDIAAAWQWSAVLAERRGRDAEASIYGRRAKDLDLYPPHIDLPHKPPRRANSSNTTRPQR